MHTILPAYDFATDDTFSQEASPRFCLVIFDNDLLISCFPHMTNDAYGKTMGTNNKELFLIDGASHIRTYWVSEYVDKAVKKLEDFFGKNL